MLPKNMIKQKNIKKAILIAVCVLILAVTAIISFLFFATDTTSDSEEASGQENGHEELIGESENPAHSDEPSDLGEAMTGDGVSDEAQLEREYYVDFVDMALLSSGNGIFDIHIRFPDGEDYVVVAGKTITGMTDEGFFVQLNDRENHMLSSARTDKDVYNGTQMYLSGYESENSVILEADYPWNQFVLGAHGVDEAEAADIYAKRVQLEENLAAFMNQTLNK